MGVYLTGMHLMGVYLMCVQLIGVYLMGVHPIDVYFMDVYMFPNPKGLWGKPPDPLPYCGRFVEIRVCERRVLALRDKRSLLASAHIAPVHSQDVGRRDIGICASSGNSSSRSRTSALSE